MKFCAPVKREVMLSAAWTVTHQQTPGGIKKQAVGGKTK
jgi:hypothetical protein